MMRARTLIIALIAIGVAALAVSGYGLWRAHRWWQGVEKQSAAADEVPSVEELRGPPIPDDENAAVVYERAWEALELSDEDKGVLTRYQHPDAVFAPREDGSLPPEVATPEALTAILAHNRRALALLSEAAAIERCRFEPVSGDGEFEYFHVPRLADLALLDAHFRAADGDVERALGPIRQVVRASHHLYDAPDGIGPFSVAGALLHRATDASREFMTDHDVSGAETDALRHSLRALHPAKPMTHALRISQARGVQILDGLAAGDVESYLAATDLGAPDSPLARELKEFSRNPLGAAHLRLNRAHFVEVTNEVIRLQREPYRDIKLELDAWEADRRSAGPMYLHAEALLPPSFSVVSQRRDQALAEIELSVVALDLKAHKHEHGSYPDSLADLDHPDEPDYALDVFAGEPLRYRLEGEGFVLWSFGRDLDDDGGVPRAEMPDDSPSDDYDVVFRCER